MKQLLLLLLISTSLLAMEVEKYDERASKKKASTLRREEIRGLIKYAVREEIFKEGSIDTCYLYEAFDEQIRFYKQIIPRSMRKFPDKIASEKEKAHLRAYLMVVIEQYCIAKEMEELRGALKFKINLLDESHKLNKDLLEENQELKKKKRSCCSII